MPHGLTKLAPILFQLSLITFRLACIVRIFSFRFSLNSSLRCSMVKP